MLPFTRRERGVIEKNHFDTELGSRVTRRDAGKIINRLSADLPSSCRPLPAPAAPAAIVNDHDEELLKFYGIGSAKEGTKSCSYTKKMQCGFHKVRVQLTEKCNSCKLSVCQQENLDRYLFSL